MTSFWKAHWIIASAFAVALAVTLFFVVRLSLSILVWSHADMADQKIEGWMTPRYVVRHWQVPRDVVAGVLGIEQDGSGRRESLEVLAARQGMTLDEVISRLEAAVSDARAGQDE